MLKKLTIAVTLFSLTSVGVLAQEASPNILNPSVYDDKFNVLMDIPEPIIYPTPDGWENVETIPENYSSFVEFTKNIYSSEPFMFWKGDEKSLTLAVAPYESYTPYQEINANIRDQERDKAAKKIRISEHFFELTQLEDEKIKFKATFPNTITRETLIPWIWGLNTQIDMSNVKSNRGVWDNNLGIMTSGKIVFSDIKQRFLDRPKFLRKIDSISISAKEIDNDDSDSLTSIQYKIEVDNYKAYDPGDDELLPVLDSEQLTSFVIFKDINKETAGPVMKAFLGINDSSHEDYELDEENLPIGSILISIDINDLIARFPKGVKYAESEEEAALLESKDNKVLFEQIAIRAEITDLNKTDFNVDTKFFTKRKPGRDFETQMFELTLFPDFASFNIKSKTPMSSVTLYESMLNEKKSGEKIVNFLNPFTQAAHASNTILEVTELRFVNQYWGRIAGSAKLILDPVGIGRGFIFTTKLIGSEKLKFIEKLPLTIDNSDSPINGLAQLIAIGESEDNKNYNFNFKFTDNQPPTLNDKNILTLLLEVGYDFIIGDPSIRSRSETDMNNAPEFENESDGPLILK